MDGQFPAITVRYNLGEWSAGCDDFPDIPYGRGQTIEDALAHFASLLAIHLLHLRRQAHG